MESLSGGYGLIEGPVWCSDRGLIYSDVLFGGVFALTADGRVSTLVEHRRGIGGISLHAAGGLVVSGRNVAFKSFAGDPTYVILDRNEAAGNVGYNDITTDSSGRIYAGCLGSSPVFDDGRQPQAGKLFCIDLDGSARVVAEDIQLTNGLGFSPDNKTLYHSDSTRRGVYCYSVDDSGALGEKRLFAETVKGAPDGLAVAEDGSVFVALAGGGAGVAVFDRTGAQTEYLEIPLPMCTSLCFGGDNLTDLYIVSGSDGVKGDKRGEIFKHKATVAGLPVALARVRVT